MVEPPDTATINEWVAQRPKTQRELVAHLAELFHSWYGPPRAYIDVPLNPVVVTYTDNGPEVREDTVWRVGFETVGVQAHGEREDVEADLVARFMVPFLAARILGLDLLIWRMAPRIETLTDPETFSTTVRLVCRVNIPGFDLSEYRAPWTLHSRLPAAQIFSTTSSPRTESTQTKK